MIVDIEVRPVAAEDDADLSAIYAHESVIAQTAQLPHRSVAFWKEFYASKGVDFLELAAVCEQRAVGHLGILLNANPRRKHVASFGIAVHPDYQGKGVGKALMDALVDLADRWLNLLKIELSVSCDNPVAIGLYEKYGFVVEGESRCDLFTDGHYSHSRQMARFNPGLKDLWS